MSKNKRKKDKKPSKQNKVSMKKQNAQGEKRKISFKAYCMGASIVLGFAGFFTQYPVLCILSIILFLVTAFLMGKEHYIFLFIGGLMALLISLLNNVSMLYMIPLIWALFYFVLMLSGMFLVKKQNK